MYKNFVLVLLFIFSSKLLANDNPKELFINHCAFCHSIENKKSNEDSLAPTLNELALQLRQSYKTDKKILSHIRSFVLSPKEEKANPHHVDKFGLMPSQKELISKRDLNIIARWIVKISK